MGYHGISLFEIKDDLLIFKNSSEEEFQESLKNIVEMLEIDARE